MTAKPPAHTIPTAQRLRWKLWGLVTRSRRICPANAYLVIVSGGNGHRLQPDWMCQRGAEETGSCYCGMLRRPS